MKIKHRVILQLWIVFILTGFGMFTDLVFGPFINAPSYFALGFVAGVFFLAGLNNKRKGLL